MSREKTIELFWDKTSPRFSDLNPELQSTVRKCFESILAGIEVHPDPSKRHMCGRCPYLWTDGDQWPHCIFGSPSQVAGGFQRTEKCVEATATPGVYALIEGLDKFEQPDSLLPSVPMDPAESQAKP